MSKGLLIVVSAPSGCGKGTILEQVLKDDNLFYSVSATTRQPRTGEVDGTNYYFKSKEEFERMIANDEVLEYATYCGNYYGTPLRPILERLDKGENVILEIEVQGAMQVKEKYPEAVLIFILPPTVAELRRRLLKRATETEEVINKRVAAAVDEISFANKYDYIMINGDLDEAVCDMKAIIRAERLVNKRAENTINEVLNNA